MRQWIPNRSADKNARFVISGSKRAGNGSSVRRVRHHKFLQETSSQHRDQIFSVPSEHPSRLQRPVLELELAVDEYNKMQDPTPPTLDFLYTEESCNNVGTIGGADTFVLRSDETTLRIGSLNTTATNVKHGVAPTDYSDFEPVAFATVPGRFAAANRKSAVLFEYDGSELRRLKKWSLRSRDVSSMQLQLAASADGSVLVASAADYLLRLKTDARSPYLRIRDVPIWGLAVSPDSGCVATSRADGRIELRDPDTLKARQTFSPTSELALAMAFSPDGKQLAIGDDYGALMLLDTNDGSCQALENDGRKVVGLHWLPDGRLIVVNLSQRVRVYRAGEWIADWTYPQLEDRYIQGSAILGDGSGVLLACESKGLAFQRL